MAFFEEADYRQLLKKKVKEANGLTWKRIAARVPVQYTYLSRAMNHGSTHLSEDHLHEICQILHFLPNETEYVLTLRGLEVAASQSRRSFLQKKLMALRLSQQTGASQERGGSVSRELHFLLSPLAWVVFFGLDRKELRENPRKIAQLLGIEAPQLRSILHTLHDLGLIEIEDDIFSVKKVNKNYFHYGFDHPLTHYHQQMLRLLCDSHYLRQPEDKRHRFMVTFNADEPALQKIEQLFAGFIKEVEKVAVSAPSRQTFQLNFELFRWL
jgi:uncharacterized protein (TIGR02147 family)